ncbi:MAG: UDP-N-acetylmuramoyl-tripeptide--D-alanyl-D-alanine ligase [Acidobacteriota bacterium]
MAGMILPLDTIAAVTGGRVLAPAERPSVGLALDSRRCEGGRLFAALRGTRNDGHDYLADAALHGAAAALVERELPVPAGMGAVLVPSVERALAALGRHVRDAFPGTVAGVVGSCGKTTTKDFCAALLRRLGPVHATAGNRNNLLGLPATLLEADASARFWVLEMGISRPGEMEDLAPIARPTAVVFTTIQPVHTEFFPSLEAIRDEKARVLAHVPAGGLAVLNHDDPLLCGMEIPGGLRRATYGRNPGADLRVFPLEKPGPEGSLFVLERGGRRAEGILPLAGRHNLMNLAAAACLAVEEGLSLEEAARVAADLRPAPHRGERHHLAGSVLLLDDSYNSNPAALSEVLAETRSWGRPVAAALGEMLELGPASTELHREAGRRAARAGVTVLLAVGGPDAGEMARSFGESGGEVRHVGHWSEGAHWIEERLPEGGALLVKGSRGIGLDALVAWLLERRGL